MPAQQPTNDVAARACDTDRKDHSATHPTPPTAAGLTDRISNRTKELRDLDETELRQELDCLRATCRDPGFERLDWQSELESLIRTVLERRLPPTISPTQMENIVREIGDALSDDVAAPRRIQSLINGLREERP
jgi:hypothetical protein